MADGHAFRVLSLDKLVHSYNSIEEPTRLHYGYLRTYAELTAYAAQRIPGLRALFMGGGGYTLPRYMEVTYPDATLEVAEIDPGVTQTAVELMGLQPAHAGDLLQHGRPRGRGGQARRAALRSRLRGRVQRLSGPVPPHDPRVRPEDPQPAEARRALPGARDRPDARGPVHGLPGPDAAGGLPPRVRARGRGPDDGAPRPDLRRGGERDAARPRPAPGGPRARAGRGSRGADHAAGTRWRTGCGGPIRS